MSLSFSIFFLELIALSFLFCSFFLLTCSTLLGLAPLGGPVWYKADFEVRACTFILPRPESHFLEKLLNYSVEQLLSLQKVKGIIMGNSLIRQLWVINPNREFCTPLGRASELPSTFLKCTLIGDCWGKDS